MGAFSQGFAAGEYRGEEGKRAKQHLTEQEVADKTGALHERIAGVQDQIKAGGRTAETDSQMAQLQGDLTAVYHPDNGPHAMAALGKLFHRHMHGDQPAQASAPAAVLPQSGGTIQPSGAPGASVASVPGMQGENPLVVPGATGPVVHGAKTAGDLKQVAQQHFNEDMSTGLPQRVNPVLQAKQDAIAAGISAEDWQEGQLVKSGVSARATSGGRKLIGKPTLGKDGKYNQYFQNADGTMGHEAMEDYAPPAAATHQSTSSEAEFIRAHFPNGATAEQRDWAIREHKRLSTMPTSTSGSHQAPVYDSDGNLHILTEQTSSRRSAPGYVPPPGAAPTINGTPASMKARASRVAGSSTAKADSSGAAQKSPVGPALGIHKNSADEIARDKAVPIAEASYRDVIAASKNPTPVGDQGIVLAWLRGRVNRVTATEIAAVNNLGSVGQKFDASMQRTFTGKMSDQQRAWFLRSAKDNYDNAVATADKKHRGQPSRGVEDTGKPVQMKAPNGHMQTVPPDQVEHYKSLGAVVVN